MSDSCMFCLSVRHSLTSQTQLHPVIIGLIESLSSQGRHRPHFSVFNGPVNALGWRTDAGSCLKKERIFRGKRSDTRLKAVTRLPIHEAGRRSVQNVSVYVCVYASERVCVEAEMKSPARSSYSVLPSAHMTNLIQFV